MSKIYRVLGKMGRITIPFEIRMRQRFAFNDVVSFEEQEDHSVVIRREKICDHCNSKSEKIAKSERKIRTVKKEASILDVVNTLDTQEKKALLKYLARQLADVEES